MEIVGAVFLLLEVERDGTLYDKVRDIVADRWAGWRWEAELGSLGGHQKLASGLYYEHYFG